MEVPECLWDEPSVPNVKPRLLIIGNLLLAASAPHVVFAQIVADYGQNSALGGQVALTDVADSELNPAAHGGWDRLAITMHAARPYHGTGLGLASLAATFPAGAASVGVGIQRLGYDAFSQLAGRVQAAGRWDLSSRAALSVGLRLRGAHLAPSGYSPHRTGRMDAGWIARLDRVLSLGVFVRGLAGSDSPLLAAGLAARADSLFVGITLQRQAPYPASVGIGLEASPTGTVSLRGGLTTEPLQICGGFGLRIGAIRVDLAAVSHAALGLSSSVTVTLTP